MKATGIVRRIDDLGRVVIPKEIRRTLRIREGDPLEIFTDAQGGVIFKKYSPVGELSNFILGCALVVPAGLIYKRRRTRKTAVIGMLVGTVCFAALGIFSNYCLIFPFYVKVMGFPMDAIVAMGTQISPILDSEFKLILLSVTPYNIVKGLVICLLTFLLYKRLRPIMRIDNR